MLSTAPLRIAQVCKSYSPTSETFVHDYVTELHARQELDCHVVAFERINASTRPFANFVTATPPRLATWRGLVTRSRDGISTAWHGEARARVMAMHEAIRAVAPDVVHAHFGPTGVIALGATDAPLVVSYHGFDVTELLHQPIWLARYRRLWQHAAAITVVSNLQRDAIAEAGCPADKVHVVRVGKRMEELSFEVPRRAVRHFICVGRFTEKKGQLDAVRAIERARRNAHDVSLELVGDGKLFDEVAAYVKEHNLDSVVELLGARRFDEVIERMRAADALILCSKVAKNGDQEGVPTVLMEAQALGLPCISTQHAGIPEVIPEANHWVLAPEGDIDGVAERIGRLATSEPAELADLARRGREKIEREFNLAAQVELLSEIYRTIAR